jgi:hypothetical protein
VHPSSPEVRDHRPTPVRSRYHYEVQKQSWVRENSGFSLRRFLGISQTKAMISRRIGISLTGSERQRTIFANVGCLIPILAQILIAGFLLRIKINPVSTGAQGCHHPDCRIPSQARSELLGQTSRRAVKNLFPRNPVRYIWTPYQLHWT